MQNIFSHITWRLSRKLIVSLGIICLILGGVYIWASRQIYAYRMNNLRNDYLAYYAGCEKFSPAGTDETDIMNKNWRVDSQESHFTHADVVEYMMKHCPLKSDEEIESLYSYLLDGVDRYPDMDEKREGLKRISSEKVRRDYQLKFINKDLDVFRE